MNRLLLLLPASLLLLASCSNMPSLIQWHDDRPDYAQSTPATSSGTASSRMPLDVPPELRAEYEMPGGSDVATKADEKLLPKEYQDSISGKAISLDARAYHVKAEKVFSAVVDAMTSMNVPVQSVDSPSGIITSDWIRKGEHSQGFLGTESTLTRHRFIVRIYRAQLDGSEITKLEVRTHGQAAPGKRWVNAPPSRKVSEELFSAIEEQLTRMQQGIVPNSLPAQ